MPNIESLPEALIISMLLLGPPQSKKTVSAFVNTFSKQIEAHSTLKMPRRRNWEHRLGDEIWKEDLSRNLSQASDNST